MWNYLKRNYGWLGLSVLLFVALFNPWFMKYDYGAGFPMVILAVGYVTLLGLFEWRTKRKVAVGELVVLTGFSLLAVLSFEFSSAKNLGFSEMLMFAMMPVFYLILAHSDFQWWQKLLRVVAVFALLSVLLGFFQYLFTEEVRMSGPFMNIFSQVNVWPNALAMFLLMTWPLVLLLPKGKNDWGGVGVLSGIVLAGLLLTFSRGAYLVLGLQLGLLAFYYRNRFDVERIKATVLAVIIALALSVSFTFIKSSEGVVVDVGERITFNDPASGESRNERIDFWLNSMEMMLEKPVLGYGPFSFRQVNNGKQDVLLASADHPHNFLLKIGAEYGVLALSAIIIFGALWLGNFKKFRRLNRQDSDSVFVLSVAIIGAFAHNMIDYNFNFVVNFMIFWFLLAVVTRILRQEENDCQSSNVSCDRPWAPVLIAVALFVVVALELFQMVIRDKNSNLYDVERLRYPREEFLAVARDAHNKGQFDLMKTVLDKHLALNRVDSEGFYWLGKYYCAEKNVNYDLDRCLFNYELALRLNPLNELAYYADYLEILLLTGSRFEIEKFAEKSLPVLENYYYAVQMNMHFTGYTENVEAAARLADLLVKVKSLDGETKKFVSEGKVLMLDKAARLRAGERW